MRQIATNTWVWMPPLTRDIMKRPNPRFKELKANKRIVRAYWQLCTIDAQVWYAREQHIWEKKGWKSIQITTTIKI